MAHGSEDYWMSQGRWLLDVLAAIKDSVSAGGILINTLDGMDGSIDGIITLDQLNSAQCEMLVKLTGIDIDLLAGSDLLNKLDAVDGTIDDTISLLNSALMTKLDQLDGTMDGKLTLAELNSETQQLLAKLAGIDISLLTGGDITNALDALDGTIDGKIGDLQTALLTKLDTLDGTMDGKLDLADLNSAQCDMLAKLLGIEEGLGAGSDLLNKLDALDGTMDGKLTLTQLNSSNLNTQLVNAVTQLTSAVTNLATLITGLDSVLDELVLHTGYLATIASTALTEWDVIVGPVNGMMILSEWPSRNTAILKNNGGEGGYLTLGPSAADYTSYGSIPVNSEWTTHTTGTVYGNGPGGDLSIHCKDW